MSRLLAIETSSEACSVALGFDGEVLQRSYHEPRRHAELLLPSVSELLAEASVSLSQLDAIAFGRGPGSFTSLRIGIGVVQGLAWGSELGVVPVSSLAAVARGAAKAHDAPEGTMVVVAMDARMEEVFHACFRVGESGSPVLTDIEAVGDPGSIIIPDKSNVIAAGNGFQRYDALRAMSSEFDAVFPDQWPCAVDVLTLATEWLVDHEPLPAHGAQPLYIRDNVAKKSADQ